ncbi:MAG TPA: DUF2298 domain-containing protein [Candidatus Saccharimonadales bacterium]|nr:DUF2298 domain-containing protein [Candidatus Saccharimonadales bacterium]
MNIDLLYIFQWWALLLLLGIISLPLTAIIFRTFFDKGYIFSKIISLAIVSYLVFLSGTMQLLPFTQYTIIIFLLLYTLANGFILYKTRLFSHIKSSKKYIATFIFEELVFFIALRYWAYVRAFTPDIHELEKFMDFGFVNSILRATYFPPKDMWFTPFPINYYYFGHFSTAVLTKLSGIASNITFNLMLATLFAFCFMCTFSLVANLTYALTKTQSWEKMREWVKRQKIIIFITGLLSAILITFGGNLHILYAFFKSYGNDNPVPLWQLPFLPGSFPNAYWYPNATRFIYHTIHEFPMYSFVVSDLHGHVLDIPFVLLIIAILFSLISKSFQNHAIEHHIHYFKIGPWRFANPLGFELWNLVLIGFFIAVMYMTNAWDGLMYLLLTIIILAVIIKRKLSLSFFEDAFFWEFLPKAGIVFICFLLFSLPFSLFFQAGEIVHGIGVLCSPKFLTDKGHLGPFLFEANHCQHSPWWQLLTLYGFFYIWAVPFVIFIWSKRKQKQALSDIFVFILILFSTFLIIVPEFFYLKDIYPEHYRANTMFKLVYQAFMILSLSSGYIIIRFLTIISSQKSRVKSLIGTAIFLIPTTGLIILVAGVYPYYAITSYYGDLKNSQSLDGTKYLKPLYPSDADAINWLNKNISGQPVILEAQGDSYTDYARVSANTGLPTVLGWTVHEWLWRGTYDVPAPRITDVQTLYVTTDIPTAVSLIRKYNIKYVFLGDMERKKYQTLQMEKFNKLGKIIYRNGSTIIYQITI